MPYRYPQEVTLRDGRRILIRPMTSHDTEALWGFFQSLPAEMRRFAWDKIDDRALVESWGANIDYDKVLPLVAVDGTRIVADATLHRRKGGPLRLVGRIRWFMAPEYRGVGLGTFLVNSLIQAARGYGLRHVSCMLISDLEADAVETLTELGFKSYVQESYGTDPDGNQHDMTKLVFKL